MNRRAFVSGLGAVLAAPRVAAGQQAPKVWRIGYLIFGGTTPGALAAAFREGLRQLGYFEGKDYVMEYRGSVADVDRLPALAAELVASRVDVIVAAGNRSVLAAKTVTTDTAIVMPWVLDPVGTGIVASLARPGGNVTGLTYDVSPEQVTKRLELFKQLIPAASRIAALWNPTYPGLAHYWPPARKAAASLGINLYGVEVTSEEDVDGALVMLSKAPPNALFIWGDPVVWVRRREILEFASKRRLPTLTTAVDYVEAGGLMTYATNTYDLFRRAAGYVDRIFKGAKPGDLPIEQPTKFDLVINLKTAKALRLTIPPSLLLRADRVIE
jgi:ABC-type uncharacterized transport system substrate-binding protein